MTPPPEELWEKKALHFFLFLLVVGLVVVPAMAARYAIGMISRATRFVLGLPGRPFGRRWFATTRHLVWKVNFVAMPPDDGELARWLAARPGVVTSSVAREPYWVVFDCVLRGYFFDAGLKLASVRTAQSLGYDHGGRVVVMDILE